MSERRAHWERVWTERAPFEVSWYQPEPEVSLRLVTAVTGPADAVVDVGGGVSALVLALAGRGYRDLTVVDHAAPALDVLDRQLRLTLPRHRVALVASDVLTWTPDRAYRCWHDRAALHFLTEPAERRAYAEAAAAAVEPGGHVVLAGFAADGPERCSGLPVHRCGPEELATLFARSFDLVGCADDHHLTPWHAPQHFQYVTLRRR